MTGSPPAASHAGDPWPSTTGRKARIVRVSGLEGLPAALITLGLGAPRPVLVLVGGADGLDLAVRPALSALFHAMAPALRDAGASVLDGGTRSGVMALMGEAAAAAGLPLLGVVAAGTVCLPDACLVGRPDLDPGHSHFLLVPGEAWGDESPWLAATASVLAGALPSLTLVAGGGEVTARDVCEGLRLGRPTLVLAGTGGTADALAAHLSGGGPPPFAMPPDMAKHVEVMDLSRAAQALPLLLRRRLGGRA